MVCLNLMEDTVYLLLVYQDIHNRYLSLNPICHVLLIVYPKHLAPIHRIRSHSLDFLLHLRCLLL